jgi:hypothetical protein
LVELPRRAGVAPLSEALDAKGNALDSLFVRAGADVNVRAADAFGPFQPVTEALAGAAGSCAAIG